MNPRILIVGAGGNQICILRKARELGLETVAIDGNANAQGFAAADIAEVANITDPEEIERVARRHNVSGIYPAAEWGVEAASHAAARMGLPGIPPQVASRVRNKHAMRQALERAGVPVPRFRGVTTRDEAHAALQEFGAPIIVKPAEGNASKGVRRVDRAEELAAAFDNALPYSRTKTVLIETFMEGEEYCVDGLVHNGTFLLGTITGKERSEPPNRFDLGIYAPPMISQKETDAIVAMTQQALAAIEFGNGTTHIEVIATPEGVRIVEMAGRPGGGRIPTDIIPLTYGMDFIADSLRLALGDSPRERRRFERGAALFWFPARPGIVREIAGLDAVRALPGVIDVVMAIQPGDVVSPIIDCVTRDRIGYALTAGHDASSAIATAKQAQRLCRIVTA
ncbi:MAG TPA: ATP-grasp domain-containing protein [Candidatus Hydrogenedentes bacterium]|nr:ATP-grasp domain-containing protein [Candidatus Hydrogenedentota bacterium]HOS01814.1 ATP-grasp domain-containing protein [Candidatus Hydrogenedentota bacterium]